MIRVNKFNNVIALMTCKYRRFTFFNNWTFGDVITFFLFLKYSRPKTLSAISNHDYHCVPVRGQNSYSLQGNPIIVES